MGQELLNRGVIPHGTIWGATALLHKKYHKLLVKTHLDFINAGAEVIVTNSFGSRKRRLIENKLGHKFNELNKLAGKLAREAVKKSRKNVLIAGSLPPQNFTYFADLGKDLKFIKSSFKAQAKCLCPYIDFFYLDVMSSLKECQIAINSIKSFKKEFLLGIHIRKGGKLPSGEKLLPVIRKVKKYKPIGIIVSCVSIEDVAEVFTDLKKIKLPFGFKINALAKATSRCIPPESSAGIKSIACAKPTFSRASTTNSSVVCEASTFSLFLRKGNSKFSRTVIESYSALP